MLPIRHRLLVTRRFPKQSLPPGPRDDVHKSLLRLLRVETAKIEVVLLDVGNPNRDDVVRDAIRSLNTEEPRTPMPGWSLSGDFGGSRGAIALVVDEARTGVLMSALMGRHPAPLTFFPVG